MRELKFFLGLVAAAVLATAGPAVFALAQGQAAGPLSVEQENGLKPNDAFRECENCPEMALR